MKTAKVNRFITVTNSQRYVEASSRNYLKWSSFDVFFSYIHNMFDLYKINMFDFPFRQTDRLIEKQIDTCQNQTKCIYESLIIELFVFALTSPFGSRQWTQKFSARESFIPYIHKLPESVQQIRYSHWIAIFNSSNIFLPKKPIKTSIYSTLMGPSAWIIKLSDNKQMEKKHRQSSCIKMHDFSSQPVSCKTAKFAWVMVIVANNSTSYEAGY